MAKIDTDKQIPKLIETIDNEDGLCPTCGGKIDFWNQRYCRYCGQALDWSEQEESLMAKAVLVINSCRECPYIDYKESIRHIYCGKNALRELDNIDERPDWCPLTPEPERMTEWAKRQEEAEGRDYVMGMTDDWNACLDALEGKND